MTEAFIKQCLCVTYVGQSLGSKGSRVSSLHQERSDGRARHTRTCLRAPKLSLVKLMPLGRSDHGGKRDLL